MQMNDLNYYIGDSLARLERYAEAEPYLQDEVRLFPHNTRARAGLAMLYRAMGRDARLGARNRGAAARLADARSPRRRRSAVDDVRGT